MKTIETKNLKKSYGLGRSKKDILKNVNLIFEEGKCYLFVGENGCGKTTLLKAILGLIKIKGTVSVENQEIGYVPDNMIFPEYITLYQFLYNMGLIKGMKTNSIKRTLDILITEWELKEHSNKKIRELSKGMKQKILIIQAMMNNPRIYIFDEVLNGLDSAMQNKLLNFIVMMKKTKKTIIITSHYYDMYKSIANRVISIIDGETNERLN
ncbi:MAG: ABC transporter ATP-binding protein [Bacilli bacterium]|nr:ABC transporter ATP-binding protein [Bacilli bacterium]